MELSSPGRNPTKQILLFTAEPPLPSSPPCKQNRWASLSSSFPPINISAAFHPVASAGPTLEKKTPSADSLATFTSASSTTTKTQPHGTGSSATNTPAPAPAPSITATAACGCSSPTSPRRSSRITSKKTTSLSIATNGSIVKMASS